MDDLLVQMLFQCPLQLGRRRQQPKGHLLSQLLMCETGLPGESVEIRQNLLAWPLLLQKSLAETGSSVLPEVCANLHSIFHRAKEEKVNSKADPRLRLEEVCQIFSTFNFEFKPNIELEFKAKGCLEAEEKWLFVLWQWAAAADLNSAPFQEEIKHENSPTSAGILKPQGAWNYNSHLATLIARWRRYCNGRSPRSKARQRPDRRPSCPSWLKKCLPSSSGSSSL